MPISRTSNWSSVHCARISAKLLCETDEERRGREAYPLAHSWTLPQRVALDTDDDSALQGKLQGVGQKVDENLPQVALIADHLFRHAVPPVE